MAIPVREGNVASGAFADLDAATDGALSRAVAVHPTATAGRAVDQVNANTAEREARAGMGDDDLIPRLRAV